jgi:hypothetical protein
MCADAQAGHFVASSAYRSERKVPAFFLIVHQRPVGHSCCGLACAAHLQLHESLQAGRETFVIRLPIIPMATTETARTRSARSSGAAACASGAGATQAYESATACPEHRLDFANINDAR